MLQLKKTARVAGANGVSLSVLAMSLAAATAGTPALAQDGVAVETIIVSTTRREEDISDVPASVAAASGEALAPFFESGQDVLALAGRFPSLYVESSNGRVAPRFYIRGLGNTDFDLAASQPVSVIMDEIVQENVILKSFPIFDVDQVEISRGPQGTLFGRNTTAGIVKFDSRKPTDVLDGYATVSYGSFDTTNFEGAVGGPIMGDTLMGRIAVLSQYRSDWIDNAFTGEEEALGGYQELAGRAQLLWEPTDTFSVLGNVHSRSLEGTAAVFRANILTTGSNKLNGNFDRDRVWFDAGDSNPQLYDSVGGSVNIEWALPNYTLYSITGYETTNGRSKGDIDGGACSDPPAPAGLTVGAVDCDFDLLVDDVSFPGFIPFGAVTQDSIDTLDQYTQEFRVASSYEGPFNWQAGAFYFDGNFKITTVDGTYGATQVKHENESWAVFGNADYDLTDRLTVSGGLRYTDDQKEAEVLSQNVGAIPLPFIVLPPPPIAPTEASDEQLSWDASLLYDVTEDFTAYARVARGFRGPTIQARDVAFQNPSAPSIADSETSLSYEAGFKSVFNNDQTRLNGDVFYYTVEDMQFTAVGGGGNFIQLLNAEEGVGYGFEMELQSYLTDNLFVTGGFSYNETEIQDPNLIVEACGSQQCTPTDPIVSLNPINGNARVAVDGNPFPQAPDFILNATARYGIPITETGELFIYTDWFWQGDTNLFLYESQEFNSSGNFEGGLKIGYAGVTNVGRTYEAAVFARNITDEENLVGGIDFNNLTGFVNEPRVIGVSLSASLN